MSASPAFTAEQLAAIERRGGPLLISASAGSGKTSVLVERYVRAVLVDGLRPDELLAITFTDKAAGELRGRVRSALRARGERDAARAAEAAWIMTFHGLCARVLRSSAVAAGLDPAFVVLDPAEVRSAQAAAFERALELLLADRGGVARSDALDLVAGYGIERLRAAITSVHDELRSRGDTRPALPSAQPRDLERARSALGAAVDTAAAELATARGLTSINAAREALASCRAALDAGADPAPEAIAIKSGATELQSAACDAYREACAAWDGARADAVALPALALLDELLGGYGAAYADVKRARGGLDYDDLLVLTRDLLEAQPAIAAAHAGRFRQILVDEFQDTNPLQLALLELLGGEDVCVVGDELQSIYRFRHADVGVFRDRRRALEQTGATLTLATSFRARPELVDVIDTAFAGAHASWTPLRAGRSDVPAAGAVVELLVTDTDAWTEDPPAALGAGLPSARPERQAEARFVAQRIAELVRGEGFAAGDVVVLMRATSEMALFERALTLQGLPTLAAGGRGWWARQQIADLCAYLAALANPRDEVALLGLLASPLVGVCSDTLALLAIAARERGSSPYAALCEAQVRVAVADEGRLAAFRAWFAAERAIAPRLSLDVLLSRVIERTGYDLHVLGLPGGSRRLANVHRLMALAASFEARRGRDLRGFVDLATAEVAADAPLPDAPVDLGGMQAVRLMTIHAAKGLEFPVVVVADLGRRPPVGDADLLVEGAAVGVRLARLDGGSLKAFAYEQITEARKREDDAEERRVIHVGITRAQERLILSGAARMGDRWPESNPGAAPISWIGPALDPQVASLTAAEPERRRGAVRVALSVPSVGQLGLEAPAVEPGAQLVLRLDDRAPAVAIRAPERTEAVVEPPPVAPTALSYSALAFYAACPYRFHLERGLRLPEQEAPLHLRVAEEAAVPAAAGLELRLRGTLVHELLEALDAGPGARLPDAGDVLALAERHEAAAGPDDVADLLGMVERFARSEVRARIERAVEVHREYAFAFAIAAGPLVNGVVDVLAVDADGTALVVDYKSDHLHGAEPEDLVRASYGAQRRIYALAGLRAGHPRVEIAHVFLERPDAPALASYDATEAATLEAELTAGAAPLLAGDFPVAPRPHRGLCATCPGRGGLCSWPTELTDRPASEAA